MRISTDSSACDRAFSFAMGMTSKVPGSNARTEADRVPESSNATSPMLIPGPSLAMG